VNLETESTTALWKVCIPEGEIRMFDEEKLRLLIWVSTDLRGMWLYVFTTYSSKFRRVCESRKLHVLG
jgi:hypothetical protein